MKIDFNITTSVSGLKGQVKVYGRFSSKKKAVEALNTSMHFFNGYASIGALGNTGNLLIPLYPENTLIATKINHFNLSKPFTYWVLETGGSWEEKHHNP